MLRRISKVVEVLGVVAILIFLVMLFANDPVASPPAPAAAIEAAGGIDGSVVYEAKCAGCHGGDGSGGIGPKLADRVVVRFPDPAAQVVVITEGKRGMPAFGGRLTEEEIAAVVEYTRTLLGT